MIKLTITLKRVNFFQLPETCLGFLRFLQFLFIIVSFTIVVCNTFILERKSRRIQITIWNICSVIISDWKVRVIRIIVSKFCDVIIFDWKSRWILIFIWKSRLAHVTIRKSHWILIFFWKFFVVFRIIVNYTMIIICENYVLVICDIPIYWYSLRY